MPAGRFAPSPTGPLHVGNLRTALVAWLFARASGSRFRLRIEDLDRERSRPEFEAGQLEDLAAIGLDWDGELIRQSERTSVYREALGVLEEAGRVYPCWCTRAEIQAAVAAPHSGGGAGDGAAAGGAGAYPGTCRDLSNAERAARARDSGRAPSLRLRGAGERVEFSDRLRGRLAGVVDDVVLWRWDGTPAYNLAVVVDDAGQGIEEVVRGNDLIDVTPGQILLHRLLGGAEPAHAHVPLILGPDGARLAKRHGAVTLGDLAGHGLDAAGLVAWMAVSLGLAEPGERLDAPDLVARFDPGRIAGGPVTFSDSVVSSQ